MSKICPKCECVFEGHVNKRFCTTECKNAFHNHIKAHGKSSHLYKKQKHNHGYGNVTGTCACGKQFTGHKNKKFCDNRCKDRYHNLVNPRGIYAHLADTRTPEEVKFDDDEKMHKECMDADEFGWDGHKCW